MSTLDYYRLLDSMPIRMLVLLMLNLHPQQVDIEGLPDRFSGEDLADQSRLLLAALEAGTLVAVEGSAMPPTLDTKVITSSAVLWFRSHGYAWLADRLDLSQPTPSRQLVKRKELIDALARQWPTIESDLKRASSNDLSSARSGGGYWDIDVARAWAQDNHRLVLQPPQLTGLNDPFGRA